MRPFFQINPTTNEPELALHDGQLQAWESKKRLIFILAGTQSGKTVFGPWWLWREIFDEEIGKGAGDYLAVTANYPLFTRKMLPELINVFTDVMKVGRYWGSSNLIEIKNPKTNKFEAVSAHDSMWGRILLASASAGRGKVGVSALESATVKAAWLDECGLDDFSISAWESILRRLSLSRGRVLGTTTLYNFGWLRNEIYTRWERGDPDYDVIQFDSLANPVFPREEYERARRTLPGWKFSMQYQGIFARPAGMIYADFDPKIHVVAPFKVPPEWPRCVGVDPGPLHTATVWLAQEPLTGCYYVYQETLEGGLHAAAHAQRALARAEGENVTGWIGGSTSELQVRLDWQHEGVNLRAPPLKDVEAQIDRVTQLLRERRLYFFTTCVGILDEINTYSREVNELGEPTLRIRDKESYHRLDALRYIVSGVTRGDSIINFGGLAEAFRGPARAKPRWSPL